MFAARFPSYRLRRWPNWDPAAERWEPLAMWEQPQNRRQAFLGAGLSGLRWRRRHLREEALMTPTHVFGQICDRLDIIAGRGRRLSDEEIAARLAWRPAPERVRVEHRLRCRLWGSLFWLHDLSDDTDLAEEVVRAAAAEPDSGLEELAPGFWMHGVPPSKAADPEIGPVSLPPEYVGLCYAGAGSGFASMHALNRVGWTAQMTAKTRLAVMAGTPEPLHPAVVHEPRSSPRRLELTWAEITFLEALHVIVMAEQTTDAIIGAMHDATMIRRLGSNASIRASAVRETFRSEPQLHAPGPPEVQNACRAARERILASMPDTMSAQPWTQLAPAGVFREPL